MTTLDYSVLIALIFPMLAAVGLYARYRITKKYLALIMIPSLLYVSLYYAFLIFATHYLPEFTKSDLQIAFRVGGVLISLSILIYAIADALQFIKIEKEYKAYEKEKQNGRDS